MNSSLLKSIRFNMENKEDRELYEWLSHLPHGDFSVMTKKYWLNLMKPLREGE